jgi:HEAT repeat protein
MNINEIKKEYEFAKRGESLSEGEQVKRNMRFIKILISDNSDEVINYHYNLLKNREYKDLYYDIRAAFKKRPEAENFLLNTLPTETDPIAIGDILHLLGGLRSSKAAPLAREFVNNDNDYQREVALYVLGWVGDESDISILGEHLLGEASSRLRITAASAHRQIHFRLPELKNKLLASLKQGFEKETDDKVIPWIIVMIESIALKRLGLREDKQVPYIIHGDTEKAKLKTAKFLTELDLG